MMRSQDQSFLSWMMGMICSVDTSCNVASRMEVGNMASVTWS